MSKVHWYFVETRITFIHIETVTLKSNQLLHIFFKWNRTLIMQKHFYEWNQPYHTTRPVIDCRMCRIIVDMTLNPTLRHKLSLVDTIRHISIVVKTSEAPFWIDWLSFKIYIAPSLGHDIAKKSNCRRRYWLQPCDFTVFTSVYRIKMAIADQTELI